jgi:hypothetical protein
MEKHDYCGVHSDSHEGLWLFVPSTPYPYLLELAALNLLLLHLGLSLWTFFKRVLLIDSFWQDSSPFGETFCTLFQDFQFVFIESLYLRF